MAVLDIVRKRGSGLFLGLALLLLTACGVAQRDGQIIDPTLSPREAELESMLAETRVPGAMTPEAPLADLTMTEQDVSIAPLPVQAGVPFTITAVIHNNLDSPAVDVPLMIHISAEQETLGFSPFYRVLTATFPSSQSVPVQIPVNWNLAGGEHRLWVQVNRLPESWQAGIPVHSERDISDNIVLQDLVVEPFDASTSDLCPGRVDVGVEEADVFGTADGRQIQVRVHNLGNRAVYNLPVVVLGVGSSGIAYTAAIPPCGGTSLVMVELDQPVSPGDPLTVQVNPDEWVGGVVEDDLDNNLVRIPAVPQSGLPPPPASEVADYDFGITTSDIGTPELWFVQVRVRNLGTRDADMVPVRIENEAGRKITDAIPLVLGEGTGVAVIRVSYLWIPGGILTFTVNPSDASGAYPEANREDNVATFVLP